MARKSIEVNKEKLIEAIKQVEANGPLANRNEVNEAAAALYNKSNPDMPKITKGIVYLRIRSWGIELITPKGKRGRAVMTESHKHKLKAGRARAREARANVKDTPMVNESIAALKKRVEPRFYPLVQKVKKGSRAAAVKLFCLECVGFKTADVRSCTATHCPLWLFRPYQGDIEPEEQEQIEVEKMEV